MRITRNGVKLNNESLVESSSVATYLMTGRRKKINKKHVRLLGGKRVGVATNVYSRKMLEKPKRRSVNFENKDSEVVYT